MPNAMQRAMDELNPTPDYSDGSAFVNEATINGAVQQNQQAQQAAMLQQLLTNPNLTANLESSALGQAMQDSVQQQPSTANLFRDYSRNSNDIYESAYSDLLRQGYTTRQAEYGAAKAARDYKANRIANAQTRMENGGYDPATGMITNQGLRALIDMQSESPEAASLWSQAYDLPRVGYAYGRDIAKGDYNAARQFDYSQRGADAQMERQIQLYRFNRQMQNAELARRAQYAAQGAYYEAYMNAMQQPGMTPEQADAIGQAAGQMAQYQVLAGYTGGGRSSGRGSGKNGSESGQMKPSELKTMQEFINGKIEDIQHRMMALTSEDGSHKNNPDYQRLEKNLAYWQKESDRLGKKDPELNPLDLNGATKILLDNGNSWDNIFAFFSMAKQQREGTQNPLTAGEVINAVRKNGGDDQEAVKLIARLNLEDINVGEDVEPIENNPVQQDGNRLTDDELRERANR